jgi:hypothetical protein
MRMKEFSRQKKNKLYYNIFCCKERKPSCKLKTLLQFHEYTAQKEQKKSAIQSSIKKRRIIKINLTFKHLRAGA